MIDDEKYTLYNRVSERLKRSARKGVGVRVPPPAPRSGRRWRGRTARARTDDEARDHSKRFVPHDGAGDPKLGRLRRRGPVGARAAARREMNLCQAKRPTPRIRDEIVLDASDIPHDEPDPFRRHELDRRWKERVLRHGDDDLPLGRRRATDE